MLLGVNTIPKRKIARNRIETAAIIDVDRAHSFHLLFDRLHARKVGKKMAELMRDGPMLRMALASYGFDHT